ncbi:MBL fold metallo-hydrolase [Mesobacillus subterraneus]|uniref:MBL fold metallo-hydrolase n=1 Tax=Mesobacillus subterraneus TaxID=285983 RepID=A0A3R9DQR2_9BACI|nr:MBL fold metallo-hydrolase [Mesobacillus subterraneus]RSD25130.1 MBL fold metallo-hydrolase [Mesobacillus subterraneus]
MENRAENRIIPVTSIDSGDVEQIAHDVHYMNIQIVNLCFYGMPGDQKDWVLIDAGMPRSSDVIFEEAERLFGANNPPKAIILTHGHFDHVGALVELVERWNVNVYAHELEMPYLSGVKNYPEPDPTVDGGLLAKAAKLYPNEAIKLGNHVKALPLDGTVPEMDGWRWIHTPGHTPGHISLFRDSDRTLIAGDAFVTVKQESLYKVVTQKKEISGPPRYLTTNWEHARKSVEELYALRPARAITGHGRPMEGEELERNLDLLVRDFEKIAVPDHGRFVDGD